MGRYEACSAAREFLTRLERDLAAGVPDRSRKREEGRSMEPTATNF